MTTENIHTKHHNKDAVTKRSPEIEGYIRQSIDWVLDNAKSLPNDPSVMDLGGDTGYAGLYMAKDHNMTGPYTLVEPYYPGNCFEDEGFIPDVNYAYMDSLGLKAAWGMDRVDLIISNHSLEHTKNPQQAIQNMSTLCKKGGYVYVGLPLAGTDWSYWEGHLSLWDHKFTQVSFERKGFKMVAQETRCFRGNNVEFWTLFEKV